MNNKTLKNYTSTILSLGSNLGDRKKTLVKAIEDLDFSDFMHLSKVSPIIETRSIDNSDQPFYLNLICDFKTTLSPENLLRLIQKIENIYGRTRIVKWGSRTLDIDIITYGDQIISEKNLTIPHPRAHERAFVLYPWYKIDPYASLPKGKNISDLLEASIGYKDIIKTYEK